MLMVVVGERRWEGPPCGTPTDYLGMDCIATSF